MMQPDGFFDRRLLVFNFLPSLTLHRSRWTDFYAVPAMAQGRVPDANDGPWHRHWSRHILTLQGLRDRPAMRLDDPVWPLALLSSAALASCGRRLGVVLSARRLRHVIAREQVAAMASAFGEDAMAYSHPGWGYCAPDDGEPPFSSPQEAVATADRIGTAALTAALRTADDLIWRRVELKLAPCASPSVLDGTAALGLALRLAHGVTQP